MTRLRQRVSRRGAFLILFGVAYILTGFSTTGYIIRNPASPLLHEMGPIWLRALVWITAGTVAILAAFWRKPLADTIGFTLVCVPAAFRAVSYLIGWFTYLYLGPGYGTATGWSAATTYGVITVAIMIVASWPDCSAPAEREPAH